MTRCYLHDCEYADIVEIRAGMKEAAKLKKNLYSNRIPFKTETINASPLLPTKEAAPTRVSRGHRRPPEAEERKEKARGHTPLPRLSQSSATLQLRYSPEPTHSGISASRSP